MTDVLSERALNRATLARQYLLERAPVRAIDAICQLAGMQSQAPQADWLGAPLAAAPADALVLRYLAAFGPATVADAQAWSGLTRLREVVERLPLRSFRGEAGEVLYDLPDAPRPASDTPAPPRFLPEYDNLLLSHADRGRVIPQRRPVSLPPGNGASGGTFLIDGQWQGTWQLREGELRIQPFASLPAADLAALTAEAAGLAAFIAPQTPADIVVDRP